VNLGRNFLKIIDFYTSIGRNPDARRLFSFTEKSIADIINMTYSCRVRFAMICTERER